ncbi:MAG: hypothetical protein HGA31_00865 [Candidatus Moranbacteria bacterium]|nr:hypothetical protein [Candidatus Moranbacteria bacterium]
MWFFNTTDRKEAISLTILAVLFNITSFLFILKFFPQAQRLGLILPRTFFIISLPISVTLLFGGVFYFNPFRCVSDWSSKLLLFIFPSAFMFLIGWRLGENVSNSVKLFVSFYVFFISSYYFTRLTIRKKESLHSPEVYEPSVFQWIRKQGWRRILAVVALTAVFFIFAVRDLGSYAAVDEALWLYDRIPKFWNAVSDLKPEKTGISDKPGITVALASGSGLFYEANPKSWKSVRGSAFDIPGFFSTFRLPLVILVTVLLPIFYYLLERLSGKTSALFAYSFISLSPVTIGMAKIINPDSLLWVFAPLSLFAYLTYIKRKHLGFLFLSGVLLGLALLTKYVANFLFIFMLGAIFLEYALRSEEEPFLPYLKRSLTAYALWTATALLTFFLLFPNMWVKPWKILDATIFSQAFEKVAYLFIALFITILVDSFLNRSRFAEATAGFLKSQYRLVVGLICATWLLLLITVCGDTWADMKPYDFMDILAAPKTIISRATVIGVYISNAYPLIFGVTPIVFVLLLATPFVATKGRNIRSAAGKSMLLGILFIMLYYVATSVNKVGAITRYQIMLFPIAGAVAGITLGLIVKSVGNPSSGNRKWTRYLVPTIFSILVISGFITLARTPFPLSYASALLPNRYNLDVKDMGPGSYEAAQYLNSLPNSNGLLIWTDKSGVCKFFNGGCKSSFDWTNYQNLPFDYVVVSSGRESRTDKRIIGAINGGRNDAIRFDEYYGMTDPVWELLINGRQSHYVRIYRFKR